MKDREPVAGLCGFATQAGSGGLHVAIPGDDWNFLLRRADLKPSPAFDLHYGKEIHSNDVAMFLPNWQSLRWTFIPSHILSATESYAVDNGYLVNVQADSRSRKQHQDVIDAFLRFMAHSKI